MMFHTEEDELQKAQDYAISSDTKTHSQTGVSHCCMDGKNRSVIGHSQCYNKIVQAEMKQHTKERLLKSHFHI